jgi:hypothetical protein
MTPWALRAALPWLALLVLSPRPARAQPARRDADVARRIDFIQTRFDRATPAAQLWWNGWYATYLTLTVGQGAFAIVTPDKGTREDMVVGAVTSSFGVIPLGVFGFPPRLAAAEIRGIPATTADGRRRKLARAETLLRESAETESFGRSWASHVLGNAVSIGSGAVLAFGYGRTTSGILNAVAGVAITEFQIFTQPTAAIDDWKDYSAERFERTSADSAGVRLGVAPLPGGAALTGVF